MRTPFFCPKEVVRERLHMISTLTDSKGDAQGTREKQLSEQQMSVQISRGTSYKYIETIIGIIFSEEIAFWGLINVLLSPN